MADRDADAPGYAALVRLAESPACDALHVLVEGVPVFEWATPRGHQPIETMSVTKSVVSMVVGRLVGDGLLDTIERPVSCFFPQWKGTRKARITIRHLLEHTSGLACRRTTEDIYAASDFVQHALDAELVAEPGTTFTYNNRAVNLLSEVVRQASGLRMDEYAAAALLEPLDIDEWRWAVDASRNPHCMAGLRVSPGDLAALGQLMAQDGAWNGKQLVPAGWIRASVTPSAANAAHGLLWWLIGDYTVIVDDEVIHAWRTASPPVPESFIARLEALRDVPMERAPFRQRVRDLVAWDEWQAHTVARGLPDGRGVMSHVAAYYASGSGGQFLVVLPEDKIVAARMWAMESPHEDVRPLVEVIKQLVAERAK